VEMTGRDGEYDINVVRRVPGYASLERGMYTYMVLSSGVAMYPKTSINLGMYQSIISVTAGRIVRLRKFQTEFET
jgi:hypothetical protein